MMACVDEQRRKQTEHDFKKRCEKMEDELHMAREVGDLEKIQKLLSRGVNTKSNEMQSESQLAHAIFCKRENAANVVELFLDHDKPSDETLNCLVWTAAFVQDSNILKLFLHRGFPANYQNKDRDTLLMNSVGSRWGPCDKHYTIESLIHHTKQKIHMLIQGGADASVLNKRMKSAHTIAKEHKYPDEICDLLLLEEIIACMNKSCSGSECLVVARVKHALVNR
jgi:hypothetical protein